MTPTTRATLQKAILDALRAAAGEDRPSNGELADTIGCDRTEISRFEKGERRMDLDEVVAGCEAYGDEAAAAVLGILAARFKLRVVPDVEGEAEGTPRVPAVAELSQRAANLTLGFIEAEQDGRIDLRERQKLGSDLDALAQRVANLKAGLGTARGA